MGNDWLGMSLAAAWALIIAGLGPAAADPRGLWQANDGSRVRIANCGAALCGTLASMNTPTDPATGRPWTDKHNPDQAKPEDTFLTTSYGEAYDAALFDSARSLAQSCRPRDFRAPTM